MIMKGQWKSWYTLHLLLPMLPWKIFVQLLREGEIDDAELAAQFAAAVTEKKAGHVIDTPAFLRPERAMYQIGG